MRCLIFGCGYLGQRVAKAWIAEGCEVFAVTRFPLKAEGLRQIGIRPLVADVCEPSSLADMPEVDVALNAIGFDRNSGRSQEEVSCGGTRNLLDAIKGHCKRYIQISTTGVYGQSKGEWVDETSECHPVQTGGQLALKAEALVRDAHRSSEAQFFILRLAGIYGPDRLLSRIEIIKSQQSLSGRGDAWLNLIHVEDAVRAIQRCTDCDLPGGTYIVVDDCPVERREYFEELARLVDAPPPVFDANIPSRRGSGGVNKRCSNQKARHELGWAPLYSSLKSGLPAAIRMSIE